MRDITADKIDIRFKRLFKVSSIRWKSTEEGLGPKRLHYQGLLDALKSLLSLTSNSLNLSTEKRD